MVVGQPVDEPVAIAAEFFRRHAASVLAGWGRTGSGPASRLVAIESTRVSLGGARTLDIGTPCPVAKRSSARSLEWFDWSRKPDTQMAGVESFDRGHAADPVDPGSVRGREARGEDRSHDACRARGPSRAQSRSSCPRPGQENLHRRPPSSGAGALVAQNPRGGPWRSGRRLVEPRAEGVLAHDGVRKAIAGRSTPTATADLTRPFQLRSATSPTTSGARWRDACAAKRSMISTRRFRNSCGETISAHS